MRASEEHEGQRDESSGPSQGKAATWAGTCIRKPPDCNTHPQPQQSLKSSPPEISEGLRKEAPARLCRKAHPQGFLAPSSGSTLGALLAWVVEGNRLPQAALPATLTVHLSGGDFQASVISFLLPDPTHTPLVTKSLPLTQSTHPLLSLPSCYKGHCAPRWPCMLCDLGPASQPLRSGFPS